MCVFGVWGQLVLSRETEMEVKRGQQFWIWVTALLISISFIFFASSILMPFVAGVAVAYFLDPLADKLETFGFSRTIATSLITVSFFAIAILILVMVFPLLQSQVLGFFGKMPALVHNLKNWLAPFSEILSESVSSEKLDPFSGNSETYNGTLVTWFAGLLKGIVKGGLAVFNALSLLLVTPVVCFYFLRDWDKIVSKIHGWLPRGFASSIRLIALDIDSTIAGFVRGQGTVWLFLAIFYGVGLTIVGLDFGLMVGVVTGFISFIPYFGMLIGMVVALLISIAQFGEIIEVVLVFAVFGIGQAIESMFLTPRLVGEKVGLHAIWVIFSLMVGGSMFGFTGILLAVPVAATIGVLVRFFLAQYLKSSLYLGFSDRDR